MKHTKEPWYVDHHQFIYAENHLLVGQTACPPALSDNPAATQAINADRIAACVNALHDMDNKEIDNIRAWAHGAGIGTALAMKDKAIGEYQLLVSDMEKQRDELQSRVDFLNDQNSAQQEQHDRLAALNAELVEKLEEADSLAKLAIHLNKEFKARMDECSERFTHKDGCMRRLAYRKLGWPCSCEAIAKAGG